jgi:hypothetical protein
MLVQILALSLGVSSVFASTVAPVASSQDALIVVTHLHPSSIAQQINARVELSATVGALKSHYASVDVLDSSSEVEPSIDAAIQKRQDAAHVDVIVLSGEISAPGKSKFSNLRLVYFSGHASAEVLHDFEEEGATLSMAQSDFTSSSSLSAIRFAHRWAEGDSAVTAAAEAQAYAAKFQKVMGAFSSSKNSPSLVMEGMNIDRKGGNFEPVSTGAAPAEADANAGAKSEDVTSNAAAFLDRLQPMLWEELQGVFTNTSSQPLTTETDPQAQEIWVDGEFLKFMGAPLQNFAGGKFASVLQYLEGVKLIRTEERLDINLYFSQAFDISIQDEAHAANFSLYGVHLPKTVRISLSIDQQTISLVGLDDKEGLAEDQLFLRVKIPVVSDKVYLRNGSIELPTGKFEIQAGILGDTVGLSASAQVFAAHPKTSFDFWQSLADNDSILIWPILLFQREL